MRHYILGIDPGKKSGLVHVAIEDNESDLKVLTTEELDFNDLIRRADQIIGYHTPQGLTVVVENFIVTSRTAKQNFQPFSLWLIGSTKASMLLHGHDPDKMVLQSPSAAKSLVSNAMIKDVGLWYKGGDGHSQDASRHVITYLLTHKWRPKSLIDSLAEQ